MTPKRRSLVTALAVLACVGVVWSVATPWWQDDEPETGEPRALDAAHSDRSMMLARARRSCRLAELDAFVEAQRAIAQNDGTGEAWRILAEGYLERASMRNLRLGMAVGRPMYSSVPNEVRQDLDLGDAALQRARTLGDASSESYRIDAALRTLRITGIVTGLKHDSHIRASLGTALELDPANPHAIIAVACRRMFKPFGSDPARAGEEFRAAADVMPHDERPLIFASMAAFLRDDPKLALEIMREATRRNPHNVYAVTVEKRLADGEADPFSRDV